MNYLDFFGRRKPQLRNILVEMNILAPATKELFHANHMTFVPNYDWTSSILRDYNALGNFASFRMEDLYTPSVFSNQDEIKGISTYRDSEAGRNPGFMYNSSADYYIGLQDDFSGARQGAFNSRNGIYFKFYAEKSKYFNHSRSLRNTMKNMRFPVFGIENTSLNNPRNNDQVFYGLFRNPTGTRLYIPNYFFTTSSTYYSGTGSSTGAALNGLNANDELYLNPGLATIKNGGEDDCITVARAAGAKITYIQNLIPPNKINDVTVSYNSATLEATLNFSAPYSLNGIQFYEYYVDDGYSPKSRFFSQGETTSTSVTVTLESNKSYRFWVRAVDNYLNISEENQETTFAEGLTSGNIVTLNT
jgi:hypothetical protein